MNESAALDIVVDEIFPHTPETIWKTLTTPELMQRWLKLAPSGFQPVEGTHFTYQTTPAGVWDGRIHCEVLEVVPNQRLIYTWKSGHETNVGYGAPLETTVTWTLSRVDTGTRVRMVHSGFVLPRNHTAFKGMSEGWPKVVQTIDVITAEHDCPKLH
jgi:uncharacterized protein YndB with AHSA1/START domain